MIRTTGLLLSRALRLLGLAAVAALIAHGTGKAAESGCPYESAASADQHLHSHGPLPDTPDTEHGDVDGFRCCAAISCGIGVSPAVERPGIAHAPALSPSPNLPLDGTLPGPIDRPPIAA